MTLLALHLIVIVMTLHMLLGTIAIAEREAATRTTGAARHSRLRGSVTYAVVSTTTTQAPTLRAPRQRRPLRSTSASSISGSNSTTTVQLAARQQIRKLSAKQTSTTGSSMQPLPKAAVIRLRGGFAVAGRPTTLFSQRGRQTRDTPLASFGLAWRRSQNLSNDSKNNNNNTAKAINNVAITPNLRILTHKQRQHQHQERRQLSSAEAPHQTLPSPSSTPLHLPSRGPTQKTPRMIQRLVAGYIQNAQGHSTYKVSAVNTNSSRSSISQHVSLKHDDNSTTIMTATTTTATPLYFRKPPSQSSILSSSIRMADKLSSLLPTRASITNTSATFKDKGNDDEALLSDPEDFDNWDNGILRLSAGSGKEAKKKKDDSKKTLTDQVRDGKYALIEKELFRRMPYPPGVLSYARNPEVPLDTERNYGGLNVEDIWLAEDHLLVIKGGSLNEADDQENNAAPWPAIDDYDAPERQIKIPAHPNVPPPFPVQLDAHGPIQLIQDNKLTVVYPNTNKTLSAYITSTEANYASAGKRGAGHAAHTAARAGATAPVKWDNAGGGNGKVQDNQNSKPSYVFSAPSASWPNATPPNETLARPFPKNSRPIALPGLSPWLINGLNGSLDSVNITNDFDEDDPALYYPPAYSFVYKSNYSNAVPPGPLVPGIVLPPPPNHFTRLDHTTPSQLHRPSSTSTTAPAPSRTTTPYRIALPKNTPKYNSIGYAATPRHPAAIVQQLPKYVERVPVPVAVPIPIYPLHYQPTMRARSNLTYTPPAQTVLFVPSTTERNAAAVNDTLSNSNPIYYEYLEAKRQPASKSNVIEDFLAQSKSSTQRERHYKQHAISDTVVNITQKPSKLPPPSAEYDTLGKLLGSNLIQPQHYAVYGDYASTAAPTYGGQFQPPDFDKKPFLPMVNYSADEQDKNAFKAIAYAAPPDGYQLQRQRQMRVGKQQFEPYAGYTTAQPPELMSPTLLLQQRPRELQVDKHQQPLLETQAPAKINSRAQTPLADFYPPEPPSYAEDQRSNHIESHSHSAKYQLMRSHFVRSGHLLADYTNGTAVKLPQPHLASPPTYWQRPLPAPQFKHLRHSNKYPPYSVPNYASHGVTEEPLYRLLPVPQHKQWHQRSGIISNNNKQLQLNPYYGDHGVPVGHSLAADILVNYNTNNQFNQQAELVPTAVPPPLSYQAQSGLVGGPLWLGRPAR